MGQIDVTEILTDPDFIDPIVLFHRTSEVNDLGNNVLRETAVKAYGCVQPASGKTLQRLPDEFRVANVMSFWVSGKLVSDGKCKYPDLIMYRGVKYAIQVIFDWTNWGDGWCEGTCVRERPAL